MDNTVRDTNEKTIFLSGRENYYFSLEVGVTTRVLRVMRYVGTIQLLKYRFLV